MKLFAALFLAAGAPHVVTTEPAQIELATRVAANRGVTAHWWGQPPDDVDMAIF